MDITLTTQLRQSLSKNMIQATEVLQMTSVELYAYFEQLALENPVMELGWKKDSPIEQTSSSDSYLDEYDSRYAKNEYSDYHGFSRDSGYHQNQEWNVETASGETIKDHIWSQLQHLRFTREDHAILNFLILSVNNSGFLTESIDETAAFFNTDADHVQELVSLLQSLEPSGICAFDVVDCLKLQLIHMGIYSAKYETLIHNLLSLVAKNSINSIARKLGVSNQEAQTYSSTIRSLNPNPANAFSSGSRVHYIRPDVFISEHNGQFEIKIDETSYPSISANSFYANLEKTTDDSTVQNYLREKIQQISWAKQCIAMRNRTLYQLAETILLHQLAFFQNESRAPQPLLMSTVAAELHISESTVSRAVNQKYLQCSSGIYPLSHFFSRRGVRRQTPYAIKEAEKSELQTEREIISEEEVVGLISELVRQENKAKPLSDRIIAEKLADAGFCISRRTVAKYREHAGIFPSSGRKEQL